MILQNKVSRDIEKLDKIHYKVFENVCKRNFWGKLTTMSEGPLWLAQNHGLLLLYLTSWQFKSSISV